MDKERKSDHSIQPIEDILPNFCRGEGLLALLVLAELLAILVVVANVGLLQFDWVYLGQVSFFVFWVGLLSALLLCLTRNFLSRRSHVVAALLSYVTILFITVVCAFVAQWFDGLWNGTGQFVIWRIVEITLLAAIPAGVLLRYLFIQHQLRVQQQIELESRIQALQSRIRPHFLFNSMNMIASLIASNPDLAERVVEDLSDLFRYALSDGQTLVKLDSELILTKRYVALEQLRLGNRLKVDWQIEDFDKNVCIPCLTLQPILENAIYHGIQQIAEGGLITVKVSQFQDRIRIAVRNPLTVTMTQHKGNNLALDNIHKRLQSHFGRSAELKTVDDGENYSTCISYPVSNLSDLGRKPLNL